MHVSLAQTLLKLTSPGVPDTYQGDELWNFSLVDPDNRRPVDYGQRREILAELKAQFDGDTIDHSLLSTMTENLSDGRIKCYLTWKCLSLRSRLPDLFSHGTYIPLPIRGAHGNSLFAYAREYRGKTVIVVVPRLLGRLADTVDDDSGNLVSRLDWCGSAVGLPERLATRGYRNHLTGEDVDASWEGNETLLEAERLFARFPVALLVSRPPS